MSQVSFRNWEGPVLRVRPAFLLLLGYHDLVAWLDPSIFTKVPPGRERGREDKMAQNAMFDIWHLCYHDFTRVSFYLILFRPMPPLRIFPSLPSRTGLWKDVWTHTKLFPVYWTALALVMLVGDYVAGPTIQFPILYLIPVSLASWYSGCAWGLAFAVTMPLIRLYFYVIFWPVHLTAFDSSINTIIRILVLGGMAFLVSRTAEQTRALAKRVNVLEGFLPICSFCKKIRDQNNTWQPLEQFISDRSNAQFTHGFCPDCGQRHYGDFLKMGDHPTKES